MYSKEEIPSIVTEDLTSAPAARVDAKDESLSPALPTPSTSQSGKSSDPSPLSPVILESVWHRSSADEAEHQAKPPSPALSTQSSSHFTTSTTFREHKHGGIVGLLSPRDNPRSRSQRPPKETTTDDATVNHPPHPASSHAITSVTSAAYTLNTPTPIHTSSAVGSVDSDEEEREDDRMGLNLTQDEPIDPTPFVFKPHHLASLVDPKNLESLEAMGGTEGLLAGLGTDPTNGLTISRNKSKSGDAPTAVVTTPASEEFTHEGAAYNGTVEDRQRVYGSNIPPVRKSKSLLELMWFALKDKVLALLSTAAVISLTLGFLHDHSPGQEPGKPPANWIRRMTVTIAHFTPGPGREPGKLPGGWVEGVAIIAAVFIAVMVGSLNDWHKERQFRILDDKKEERCVKVIRSGIERVIDVKELLVGDIALLEPGEIVPCDGVIISGHSVKCDESGATGESDAIKKVDYDKCLKLREQAKRKGAGAHKSNVSNVHADCFVVSGSKVLDGHGKYVVIAVGQRSFNGRVMMALRGDSDPVPLREKLNDLPEPIAKIGSAAGVAFSIVLMIYFVQLGTGETEHTPNENVLAFLCIVTVCVTFIAVAVPEGPPLAINLALAFATKIMTAEHLLFRVLGSCQTVANISVVCTDKTGTLTQNVMSVVAGSIGVHAKFVRNLKENMARTNATDQKQDQPQEQVIPEATGEPRVNRKRADDFSIEQDDINTILSPQLKRLFNQSIAINSTAFEDIDPETNELAFVGSKTEAALLQFAKDLGWENWKETREEAQIMQMIPFSSERKAMGVVIRLQTGRYRLFVKGASEILTKKCTRHVVVSKNPRNIQHADSEIETKAIDEITKDNISGTISFYANQMLRTIALCYRDFESWPPAGTHFRSAEDVSYEDLSRDMTLVAITGIEDPLRPGVRDAVASCHHAGVTVKMCTGDNVLTARSIATECGIYTTGGIIMEGPVFRALDPRERIEVAPRLQVLARSSPEDKKILVETLRSFGGIVGVTAGDGTNDGPALKTANVGFSMGIAGTEVAKEASDIVLTDDNFCSIVKAIMWGRCVNDAVRKFLQFLIPINITAVIITLVSAVGPTQEDTVLTAVQLLWINIIMDTFATIALATDPTPRSLLDRKPEIRRTRLLTPDMIKMIFDQSIYQVVVLLILHFLGHRILGLDHTDEGNKIVKTLVFNTFVFAQIFNLLNCRRFDNKLNIFEGILRNWYFIAITLIEIAGQVVIASVGGAGFQVSRIHSREWGISLALGFGSIPLGAIIRCIHTMPLEHVFIKLRIMSADEILPTTRPDSPEWNVAITKVRDNLSLFSSLRGGRVNASPFVLKSRRSRAPEEDWVVLPSLMTMVPTFIASSVGAGWILPRVGLSGFPKNDPSQSPTALWEGKLQLQPDTPPDDPASQRWGP